MPNGLQLLIESIIVGRYSNGNVCQLCLWQSSDYVKPARIDEINLVCEGCHEGINQSASRYSREREENDTGMGPLILGGKEISITCDDDEPTYTGIGNDDGIPLCA